jgi:hypothetical protein
MEVHVYQFDADQGGKPHFWSNWRFSPGPGLDYAKISCSTVARPEPGEAFIFASRSEGCFVGTADGAVLGLDMVYSPQNGVPFLDYDFFPYPMTYRTLPFGPAGGMAAPALGRFLHLALEAVVGVITPLTLTEELKVRVKARRSPLEEGENPSGSPPSNATFAVEGTASVTGVTLRRLVLLCRGQYHQIEVDDRAFTASTGISSGNNRLVALHRMTYFYQRLPETMVPETTVQAEPAD